ncbi:MAG: RIP metalloprotease RseP [Bernardetiaceae bacterium]
MEILIKATQFFLSLSILVALHELGHLLAAKYFGMRVERYSIGFPPKLFGFRWGETEYVFSLLPLGGYVKISGMIDESLDTGQLKSKPQEWEFRGKPAWQRLIVMLGGIIFNVILGFLIFITLSYLNGERYYAMDQINQQGIYAGELGEEIGFQTGDKVLAVNDRPVEKFRDLQDPSVLLEAGSTYTVLRDGKELQLVVTADFIRSFTEANGQKTFLAPLLPFAVDRVRPGSPAESAGLRPDDRIIRVNDTPIDYFQALPPILQQYPDQMIRLTILRDGQTQEVEALVSPDATLGFYVRYLLEASKEDYTLGQAVVVGVQRAFMPIFLTIKSFEKMFSGEIDPLKSVSGPIRIAGSFPGVFDWQFFWNMTGLLSMVLAFMNLLPIPALDGGHVMFLLYEMIVGRPPADKFLEVAQKAGMIFLLTLIVFILTNDIIQSIF